MTFMNTLKENAEVAGAMLLVQGTLKDATFIANKHRADCRYPHV